MSDYKRLPDIAAPRHLCRRIPQNAFTDTALVWVLCGTGKHEFWTVIPREAVTDEETFFPAPTLKEIMEKLPDNVEYSFIHKGCKMFCPRHPKFDPDFAAHDIPESAALLLFFVLNGVRFTPPTTEATP